MNISVYGSGYVGLVTGACLAEAGHTVLAVDIDEQRLHKLRSGACPIYEPGLEELLQRNMASGRLRFTSDIAAAANHGYVQFITVGTQSGTDGAADLESLFEVTRDIGAHLSSDCIFVIKSTVPPGTDESVMDTLQKSFAGRGISPAIDVVINPEFLREGTAILDFTHPDRIVLGTTSAPATTTLKELYAPFYTDESRLLVMDPRSAALTKYAANAMLALRVSFINEMARIAERAGADIEQVRHGIGADHRIGSAYLHPGPGYGGSCFPKDLRALQSLASEMGLKTELLSAIEAVNQTQKQLLTQKLKAHFSGRLAGRKLALWGLAFKPDTDDMREAPSRDLLHSLWMEGAMVQAFDPAAHAEARRAFGERPDLKLCATAEDALTDADALIIVTEWSMFRNPDLSGMRMRMKKPVIFDGRNIFDPERMKQEGFTYYGIGRGASTASNRGA